MKRLSLAISSITITGIVRHNKEVRSINGVTKIPSFLLNPGDEIDVIASELVELDLVQLDYDTQEYFHCGVYTTDSLIKVEARSFSIQNVYDINTKQSVSTAVVIVDLVF